jgi:hypothetical protein
VDDEHETARVARRKNPLIPSGVDFAMTASPLAHVA